MGCYLFFEESLQEKIFVYFPKPKNFLKNFWNKIEWTIEQLLSSVFVCCENVYWTRGDCYPRTGYNSSLPTYPHSIIVKYLIIAYTERK